MGKGNADDVAEKTAKANAFFARVNMDGRVPTRLTIMEKETLLATN
jgi:hypothetical protein